MIRSFLRRQLAKAAKRIDDLLEEHCNCRRCLEWNAAQAKKAGGSNK